MGKNAFKGTTFLERRCFLVELGTQRVVFVQERSELNGKIAKNWERGMRHGRSSFLFARSQSFTRQSTSAHPQCRTSLKSLHGSTDLGATPTSNLFFAQSFFSPNNEYCTVKCCTCIFNLICTLNTLLSMRYLPEKKKKRKLASWTQGSDHPPNHSSLSEYSNNIPIIRVYSNIRMIFELFVSIRIFLILFQYSNHLFEPFIQILTNNKLEFQHSNNYKQYT